jgi:L-seryl-tRNA(Ser) seleniumtransferase
MAKQTITEPRDFPSIEELLQDSLLAETIASVPRPVAADLIKETVAALKLKLQESGKGIPLSNLQEAIRARISGNRLQGITRVVNATGILVHTNLGRAPLPENALKAILASTTGYSNVEFDLETGQRGGRGTACESFLAKISEAEQGTVVNNCAAALFLILNTLANRKNVIISRGELVQIGGGFRIPDILKRAGARLIEVGTTNITTIADYEAAIDARTALILKVHQSNFVQAGFVQDVPLRNLAVLGKKHAIPVIHDLGSGVLVETKELLGYSEPTVQQSVRSGADLTCFSGDKLLGGMQAGLIVGTSDLVGKIKRNPLFRTVRVDKVVLALLEQLLAIYLNGAHATEIPVWSMLSIPASELYKSGKSILKEIGSPGGVSVEATKAFVGGGTLPESDIPSVALVFSPEFGAARMLAGFRKLNPPIIGRIENERFMLDLKAVAPGDYPHLIRAIKQLIPATK